MPTEAAKEPIEKPETTEKPAEEVKDQTDLERLMMNLPAKETSEKPAEAVNDQPIDQLLISSDEE